MSETLSKGQEIIISNFTRGDRIDALRILSLDAGSVGIENPHLLRQEIIRNMDVTKKYRKLGIEIVKASITPDSDIVIHGVKS